MKKYFVILFLFLSVSVFSQRNGTYWSVDSATTAIGKTFKTLTRLPLIYVRASKVWYQVTDTVYSTWSVNHIISVSKCVRVPAVDSALTVIASTKVKTPFLDGTYLKGTHSNITSDSCTNLTVSGLPKFTIASGTATPVLLDDTVGFAVTGLTTNSIVICSYGSNPTVFDTIPWVYARKAGWLTLAGKHNIPINYWIPKL